MSIGYLFLGMCKNVLSYVFIILLGVYVNCSFILNDLLFPTIFSISSCAYNKVEIQ